MSAAGSGPWTAPTVLVVDDEEPIRRLVRRALTRDAMTVREAAEIPEALESAESDPPDIVLLDVMLQGASGLDALPRFRALGLPVILVTGRDTVTDRVLGLELGADDYVVKPFDARELASRVRAVLRRARPAPPPPGPRRLVHGGLTIDLASREVVLDGRAVELTAREFDLLAYLASRPTEVCTREELIEAVWHSSPEWQSTATVTEHVRRLRLKLEGGRGGPSLRTVRGVGYRFDP